MKKAGKFYCFSIMFFIFAHSTPAQVTASAGVSASIVVPIGISKEIDLDFGNVSAGNSTGSVVLKPDGSREQLGGATLPSLTGTVTAAAFNITGAPGYLYSITLPGTPVTITNGIDEMLVDQFASDPPLTGTLGSNGYQRLSVGATLLVGALQPVGDYLSAAEFNVTVNYN